MLVVIFLMLLSTPLKQHIPAREFKLVKYQSGVSLYERWIQHNGEQVRELKAEFMIKSENPDHLEQLIKDDSKGLLWNNNATGYQVIPGKEPHLWLIYIKYDVPWPMNDYDCLLLYQSESRKSKEGITEMTFHSITNKRFPETEEITRIKGTEGKWKVEQQERELKVTYLVRTDRNRSIPRWIADPIIHNNLLNTMTGFRKLIEEK